MEVKTKQQNNMKKIIVIDRNNLPTQLPLHTTLLSIIALDYWSAPGWLWGAAITFIVILWIANIVRLFHEEKIDFSKTISEALLKVLKNSSAIE